MKYLRRILEFNSSRERLLEENMKFARQIPEGAFVLDAGAGSAPYSNLFKHAKYETADFVQAEKDYLPPTYECDLQNIPVEDNRFDFIVFNQVMEHLPEPLLVLKELRRILKPGGKMIYTGPLFFEEHEQPYDFYRYTQFGLQHLFSGAGFETERIDWLEGYFGTVAYQLRCMTHYLPLQPANLATGVKGYVLWPLIVLLKTVFAASSVLFHFMEMQVKYTKQGHPKNYIAIVNNPLPR